MLCAVCNRRLSHSFAKNPDRHGKMVAYDPLLHAAKAATFVANKEVVILEARRAKNEVL